jgi:SAM-dependent methyltransferase
MSRDEKNYALCPICDSEGILVRHFGLHSLYRCQRCASLFYFPFVKGGAGSLYEPLESCPFYLERGASLLFYTEVIHYVHGMLEAQSGVDLGRSLEVLEVGCSYGFLMDIARWLYGWHMKGVDPDPCADQGREDLGMDIVQTRLEEIQGRGLYDVIISVETVEHVPNPKEHIACMARLLRNNGFIILTTPDPSNDDLGPHLWPGEHHVICSQDGLVRLLNEVGLKHQYFFRTSIPEILAVIASRQPLRTDGKTRVKLSTFESIAHTMLSYLRSKVQKVDQPALLVRGLHFRLFELLVNLGLYSEAEPVGQVLDRLLGLEPNHAFSSRFEAAVQAMLKAPDSRSYLAAGPACLAPYSFYKGMLYLNHRAEFWEASKFFGFSARLFRKEVEEFDLTHFQTFLTAAESHEDLAIRRARQPRPWYRRLFRRATRC